MDRQLPRERLAGLELVQQARVQPVLLVQQARVQPVLLVRLASVVPQEVRAVPLEALLPCFWVLPQGLYLTAMHL